MKTYKEQKGFLQVNYRDFRIIFIQWFISLQPLPGGHVLSSGSRHEIDVYIFQGLPGQEARTSFGPFRQKIYPGSVTPEDDMVTGTGIMESWFSCHGSGIDNKTPICQA